MKICAASAIFPGAFYRNALQMLSVGVSDPVLGPISIEEVQLCPQHSGRLTLELADELLAAYPATRFRLHASCKVEGKTATSINLSDVRIIEDSNFAALGAISNRLGAPGYTIHAGRRKDCPDMATLKAKLDHLQSHFECPVGVEGMYPSRAGEWFISTWAEYGQLLDAGVLYAVDLSHLNIVATRERRVDRALTLALLSAPGCMEIHVSGNDGHSDAHCKLAQPPWWLEILQEANPSAVIFSEGIEKMVR